jgi:MFS family permease
MEPTGLTRYADAVPRVGHLGIAVLGVVTIVAYGSWYYAFGVLFDVILADTGWSEATLAGAYSVGVVAQGLATVWAGRLLDRVGSRVVLAVGGVGGGASLVAASLASNTAIFAVASAGVLAFTGACGYYHVTMTAAVRLNPDASAKAIAELTIWGAFSSFLFLPATAALVERVDWRTTTQILGAAVAVTFLAAALVLPSVQSDRRDAEVGLLALFRSTVDRPQRRAFTLALALGAASMSIVVVYQVPVMAAVGLPLATAATVAGLRGMLQVTGRIPLGWIVARLGATRSMALALTAIGLSGAVLAFSGTVAVAVVFAVLAGFGLGAMSPLQGIVVEELFDRETLGASMGVYGLVFNVGGALGPLLAGVLADSTGDRRLVAGLLLAFAVLAAIVSLTIGSTDRQRPSAATSV